MMNNVKFRKYAIMMIVALLVAMVGCAAPAEDSPETTPKEIEAHTEGSPIITPEDFKACMEKNGLSVVKRDDISLNKTQAAYDAVDGETQGDNYLFAYYLMDDVAAAESRFSNIIYILENKQKETSGNSASPASSDKIGRYEITVEDSIYIVLQNENTVIIAITDEQHEEDVRSILKDLGY